MTTQHFRATRPFATLLTHLTVFLTRDLDFEGFFSFVLELLMAGYWVCLRGFPGTLSSLFVTGP